MPPRLAKTFGWLALAAACCGVWAVRGIVTQQHRDGQHYESLYYLPPAEMIPVSTAGFEAAAADLLWIRTLLYFGEELVHRGQTEYVYGYVDAILALDDHFKAPYTWIAMAALYRSGNITSKDGFRAVAYLERAVDIWPDDGELAYELGSTLRFELGPLLGDPSKKREVRVRAMEHLATAARLGAGPPWLASLNVQFLQELGQNEQAIRHLEEMYATVRDPSEKEQLEYRLRRLKSEAYAAAFRAFNEEFEAAHLRSYPYVAPNLFTLTGPPIAEKRHVQLARRFIPETLDVGAVRGSVDSDTTQSDAQAPEPTQHGP